MMGKVLATVGALAFCVVLGWPVYQIMGLNDHPEIPRIAWVTFLACTYLGFLKVCVFDD